MIKRLIVKNLNNRHKFDLTFHPDLNIFTGRNGSGKTMLLKLIWYLLSGNLKLALREIRFDELLIETNKGDIKIEVDSRELPRKFNIVSSLGETFSIKEKLFRDIEYIPSYPQGCIFFPTFRRIEGGFSITTGRSMAPSLQRELEDLSRRLSQVEFYKFVASISTKDIDILLTKEYANILEDIKELEDKQSKFILERAKSSQNQSPDKLTEILAEIKGEVQNTDQRKAELMKPFTVLSDLIKDIFKDKSISITHNLILGETKEIITSDKLSAGEKQMLSFFSYNTFMKNSAIFIDEPEINLHVDWQRILIPTLLRQGSTNQYFMATHSPFIYSKYPNKEHRLDQDRGGEA